MAFHDHPHTFNDFQRTFSNSEKLELLRIRMIRTPAAFGDYIYTCARKLALLTFLPRSSLSSPLSLSRFSLPLTFLAIANTSTDP